MRLRYRQEMGGGGPHKSFVGRKDKGIEERNFTDAYISASARRKGPNQGARGVGEKGVGEGLGRWGTRKTEPRG